MVDQINANEIIHSSAIYIQNIKLPKSLCKKLLMIESDNFYSNMSITRELNPYSMKS